MPKMHSNSECFTKCSGLITLLDKLRVNCLYDQDYDKVNQLDSALQLINELKGEFDVTQEESK
jgi:3-deoxy-D-manno-octulosonic acid (KDO) 8-phosphate synthase